MHYEHLPPDSPHVTPRSKLRHAAVSNRTGEPIAVFTDRDAAFRWIAEETEATAGERGALNDMDLSEGTLR